MTTTKSVAETTAEFEQLMRQAVAEVDSATCFARKQTIHIYRAGRLLAEARNNLPPGHRWGKTLEGFGIPRTTAWEAMKLYELAESEEAISDLSITEAKEHYGVTKPKKDDEEDSPTPSTISFPVIASQGRLAERPSEANESDDKDDDNKEDAELFDDETGDDVDDSDTETEADATLDVPPVSPFDTLAKIAKRLEYLEADLPNAKLSDDSLKEVVEAIDHLAHLLVRIRQAISVEA